MENIILTFHYHTRTRSKYSSTDHKEHVEEGLYLTDSAYAQNGDPESLATSYHYYPSAKHHLPVSNRLGGYSVQVEGRSTHRKHLFSSLPIKRAQWLNRKPGLALQAMSLEDRKHRLELTRFIVEAGK